MAKACKYCLEGRAPNKHGDHWIVKGIDRITIIKCPNPPQPAMISAELIALAGQTDEVVK